MNIKLNNKGFAISTIMYIILVFALLLVIATMTMLSSRKVILDKTKKEVLHKIQKDKYKIGDKITYNGIDFFVIADSPTTQDYVTLLKAEPLTVDEVNEYGVGHINKYTYDSVGTALNVNGYGGMAYYSNNMCGYSSPSSFSTSSCTRDYNASDIKYVVDAWSNKKLTPDDLKEVNEYKIRLITLDDLINNLGYSYSDTSTSTILKNDNVFSFVYSSNYWYWTMSPVSQSSYNVWNVRSSGDVIGDISVYALNHVSRPDGVVRPVINLKKSAI